MRTCFPCAVIEEKGREARGGKQWLHLIPAPKAEGGETFLGECPIVSAKYSPPHFDWAGAGW